MCVVNVSGHTHTHPHTKTARSHTHTYAYENDGDGRAKKPMNTILFTEHHPIYYMPVAEYTITQFLHTLYYRTMTP